MRLTVAIFGKVNLGAVVGCAGEIREQERGADRMRRHAQVGERLVVTATKESVADLRIPI
jgi:hypothetical protein